jgi:hypothetical protein
MLGIDVLSKESIGPSDKVCSYRNITCMSRLCFPIRFHAQQLQVEICKTLYTSKGKGKGLRVISLSFEATEAVQLKQRR